MSARWANCPHCKVHFSVDDVPPAACPACGGSLEQVAPSRRPLTVAQRRWLIGGAIFAGLLLLGLLLKLAGYRPAEPKANRKAEAWEAAKSFVTDLLKSPSTAKFGEYSDKDTVETGGENEYRVRGWVDSQNSFGATVRTDFDLRITYDEKRKGNEWGLIEVVRMKSR